MSCLLGDGKGDEGEDASATGPESRLARRALGLWLLPSAQCPVVSIPPHLAPTLWRLLIIRHSKYFFWPCPRRSPKLVGLENGSNECTQSKANKVFAGRPFTSRGSVGLAPHQ
ncbi:hypothetical protein IF1G_01351 [Cordyceps javanica]|uniref:Uncharacterized protein n=1 Tax=Cordyceps javanica TaxID=43265 RepID=A0A545VBL8_9HYPO|nr:hypothetical protein IF1G_01351 [Cordyceps javanica]